MVDLLGGIRILFSTMTQKTVLVTGGARGIGRGTAEFLTARLRGCRRRHGQRPDLPFFRCDVTRAPDVRRCVRAVLRESGRLHALVNNAGLADPITGPVEKLSLGEWNRRGGHRVHTGAAVGTRWRGLAASKG
jgi:NAD(P)-dependent dehydrogenase (short-subunit alcohol dehydrogenase family)